MPTKQQYYAMIHLGAKRLGYADDLGMTGCDDIRFINFAKQTCKVSHPRFLTREAMRKLIAALTKWLNNTTSKRSVRCQMRASTQYVSVAVSSLRSGEIKMKVASLSQELSVAGSEIRILPAGAFRATDGRPQGLSSWNVNAAIANGIIVVAEFNIINIMRIQGNARLAGIESQSDHGEQCANPVPGVERIVADLASRFDIHVPGAARRKRSDTGFPADYSD